MLINKMKNFHNKTVQRYMEYQQDDMEPWKKHVRRLHEESRFLFYYDTCELEKPDGSELMIQGEVAKGELARGGHLYLYDGQGRLLGEGVLLSDPFTKEEKRRGFLRSRKNELLLSLTSLQGKDFSAMESREKGAALRLFFRDASLFSDKYLTV